MVLIRPAILSLCRETIVFKYVSINATLLIISIKMTQKSLERVK